MRYHDTVDYIMSALPMFQRIGSAAYKANLDSTIALLNRIGNPERNFRSIHIAGTNGKGSVSHILAAIFQSAGYKTGLYTSPHLTDYRERIRIDGQMIEKQFVSQFIKNNKDFLDELKPSFFEMTAGLAFDYFSKKKVDIAIVETGMGGRLDSTNMIEPEISVITNIGLDHTQFLGDTLAKIAKEKAGIIKNGIPVVVGESNVETAPIFIEFAKNKMSQLVFADQYCKPVILEHSLVPPLLEMMIDTPSKHLKIQSQLAGSYQIQNICTVVACVELLRETGYKISNSALKTGMKQVVQLTGFRGRWTVRKSKPVVVFDTGHNIDGLQQISKMLKTLSFNKLHLVIGMVDDKNHESLLKLFPPDAQYYFCKPSVPRGFDAKKLKLIAESIGLKGKSYATVASAYKAAKINATQQDIIFVGGSTFTVADAIGEE
jgi:dihydrofolate synthase/folylpolyglutamate synthase